MPFKLLPARLVVIQPDQRFHEGLVRSAPVDPLEEPANQFDFLAEHIAEPLEWKRHFAQFVLVVVQGLIELLEDPEVVDDDAEFLQVVVRPVHPGNGLEQGVIAEPLVQVHDLEDGSIKSGEQHIADDENLHPREAVLRVIPLFLSLRARLREVLYGLLPVCIPEPIVS